MIGRYRRKHERLKASRVKARKAGKDKKKSRITGKIKENKQESRASQKAAQKASTINSRNRVRQSLNALNLKPHLLK